MLDHVAHDRERLWAALSLDDEHLIAALAGRRRDQLVELHGAFSPAAVEPSVRAAAICRHDGEFPASLTGPAAPRVLHVWGNPERLVGAARAPLVAIIGTERASDYGRQMAGDLAHELALCGVGVSGWVAPGIAAAALDGAAARRSAVPIGVLGNGVAMRSAAGCGGLPERLRAGGCLISELPGACAGRRWGTAAASRIAVALASVTVVVEARELERELASARLAIEMGRPLGAVPGRACSSLSAGTHMLLRDGAVLVRGAEDVLELLARAGEAPAGPGNAATGATRITLPQRLRDVLERVAAGEDTPDSLLECGDGAPEILLALSELELMGLLARGDGGRYVARLASPRARFARSAGRATRARSAGRDGSG